MKILFICTSLEPGRDGVGDYTRLLAAECMRAGHDCRMLALNDSGAVHEEKQEGITCLRLSLAQPWPARGVMALEWARAFAPDWQSWQVVPYGFHRKGIIPREVREIALHFSHISGRRHVLLHELWLGLSAGEPLRNRMVGSFQRRALRRFLKALRADAVDTTNPAFLTALIRRDVAASHLPLYGNIPVIGPRAEATGERRADVFTGVIFGTIHAQFLPVARKAVDTLVAGARASGRALRLLVVGRSGANIDALVSILGGVDVHLVGELSGAEISGLLQCADFGIATHPWALLGKSGAVAAMLDHGLPVFVPRDDWVLRGRAAPVFSGYWPYSTGLVAKLSETPPEHMAGMLARRRAPANRVPEVAGQFLESLAATAKPAAAST